MKVRKIIILRQDDGALLLGDAIDHEGKLWLVPEWIGDRTKRTERPARIICLDGLPVRAADPKYQAHLELLLPLSAATLAGRGEGQGLVVKEAPEIERSVDREISK